MNWESESLRVWLISVVLPDIAVAGGCTGWSWWGDCGLDDDILIARNGKIVIHTGTVDALVAWSVQNLGGSNFAGKPCFQPFTHALGVSTSIPTSATVRFDLLASSCSSATQWERMACREEILLALNMLWDIGRTLSLSHVIEPLSSGGLLRSLANDLTLDSLNRTETRIARRYHHRSVSDEVSRVFSALAGHWELV